MNQPGTTKITLFEVVKTNGRVVLCKVDGIDLFEFPAQL